VYAALLTPEDHYCELTPQVKTGDRKSTASVGRSLISSTIKSASGY
jgi:hypothetical protein